MKKRNFLLELYIEDLPAQELKNISISFLNIFKKILKKYQITYDQISLFATPRRLAITIFSIIYIQKNKEIRKKGPLIQNAFNNKGHATPASIAWAQHCGINIKDAKPTIINKKTYLTCTTKCQIISLTEILKKIILYVLIRIPSKKTMHWNEEKFQFSRPIRNIVALLDNHIIPIKFFHLSSNRFSRGHLFMSPKKIEINYAQQYTSKFFYQFNVMINYEERKKFIKKAIKKLAKKLNSTAKINKKQLDEVTSLVEWPVILSGNFNKEYLKIPKKILIHTMEKCQKYFPLYNNLDKKISTQFIFISNIETKNPGNIIQGNENVLQSKLSNVVFFLKKDLEIPFINRLSSLKNICFKDMLGSMYSKTNRIRLLSIYIAKKINADLRDTDRAALLSKCDLNTYMIIEYPELQGTIGMYYAMKNKEKKTVALAIKEQYLPNSSKAKLPTQLISYALSISEKIDTITGIFSLEQNSKNHNDPFALRRAIIGIIRIIIEKNITLNITLLLKKSVSLYKKIINPTKVNCSILKFIRSKFKYFFEKKGFNKKIIQSILSLNLIDLIDINMRITILNDLHQKNKLKKITNTFKRIENILKDQPNHIKIYSILPLLQSNNNASSIENKLIKSINKIIENIKNNERYFIIISQIENLVSIINNFFDTSFIYEEDRKIQLFRISILRNIKNILLYVANFYYL